MSRPHTLVLCTIVLLGLTACLPGSSTAPTSEPASGALQLPRPSQSSETSLDEALARRRSVREYDGHSLTPSEIGQLLWAAQGVTDERGYRTAPSAGALYPLEIYVATVDGVYHYVPRGHYLQAIAYGDVRSALYEAALHQEPVRSAPAVFIISALFERTAQKYGQEQSPRYVHLEAGHAAQNLLLEAVVLGLGAVPIGAFDDEEVQKALGLPPNHEPLYLIPVGRPRGSRD